MRKTFGMQDKVTGIYLCSPQIFICEHCGGEKDFKERRWFVFLKEWIIVGVNLAGEFMAVRNTDSRTFPADDLFYSRDEAQAACDAGEGISKGALS